MDEYASRRLRLLWVKAARLRAGHSQNRNEDQQRHVHRPQRIEAPDEDAQQHGPGGGFYRYRHESSDAGGRAFVGVGQPLVERHGRDFEEQTDGGGQQGDDRDRVDVIGLGGRHADQAAPYPQQTGASGQAVEQGQAIGKYAGGKCAQQQIFQRGFIGAPVGAQESHQHVGGNRHQFQTDEDQHHVETGGHAHHAHDRKQQQGVELTVVFMLDLEIAHRHQDGNRRAAKEQVPEVNGEAIHHHRIQEG